MFPIKSKYVQTDIVSTPTEKGESIEEMLRRMTANNEPIPGNVPEIFTPAADGVWPETDIRTDRFELAMQANEKYTASKIAKGANGLNDIEDKKEPENAA